MSMSNYKYGNTKDLNVILIDMLGRIEEKKGFIEIFACKAGNTIKFEFIPFS